MDDAIRDLHLAAARASGRASACGRKIDYKSEASAERAAGKMMAKGSKALEPYPCPFCGGWHIGRKMPLDELRAAAALPPASDDTAFGAAGGTV